VRKLVFAFAASLCATAAHAQTAAVGTPPLAIPDSPARTVFKTLPKDAVKDVSRETSAAPRADALKTPASVADAITRPAAENLQRLDEIRVFGRVDPEDYVARKPPPMLAFRQSLDKQRPMTPKEISLLLLCGLGLGGLCAAYNEDGSLKEVNTDGRAEERKNNTTLGESRTRGTLQ
jgi:hypothetical protein